MPRRTRQTTTNPLPSIWDLDAHQAEVDNIIATKIETARMAVAGASTAGSGGAVPPVVVTTPAVVWKTTPFSGDFNPGTKLGNSIYLEKTKGLKESDRLDLNKRNSQEIHKYLRGREQIMGPVVTQVPVDFNPDGSTRATKNLLTQYQQITLADCQRAAIARYDTPLTVNAALPASSSSSPFNLKTLDPGNDANDEKQFYNQVHSNVVATLVKNGLTVSGYDDLLLEKHKFMYVNSVTGETEYDGPTMMYLIFQKTDPSTVVGLDSILKKLEQARLSNHSNDVDEMLTKMSANFKILSDNRRAPDSYRRLLLDALASGPNHMFNDFVQRIKDDVESGIGANSNISPDSLITAARTKFNNMEENDLWNKVDPRDAKIMALTTMVESLSKTKKTTANQGTALATATDDASAVREARRKGTTNDVFLDGLARWRIKKEGDTKQYIGKTWYWCPYHKKEGKWDGMYVLHKPEDHRHHTTNPSASEPSQPSSATGEKEKTVSLQLQSKLKEVLCTNLCMSRDDIDKVFDKCQEN